MIYAAKHPDCFLVTEIVSNMFPKFRTREYVYIYILFDLLRETTYSDTLNNLLTYLKTYENLLGPSKHP